MVIVGRLVVAKGYRKGQMKERMGREQMTQDKCFGGDDKVNLHTYEDKIGY